jgi:hypothetical protein
MRVGVGQGRTGRGLDAQMRELTLAASQPSADFAQAMGPTQLTEQHRYELTPAAQALRGVLCPGLLDQLLEFNTRSQLEYLAEHAA